MIKNRIRELWLIAQGIPVHDWARWKVPGYFKETPRRCTICGRSWRPDRQFADVFGIIMETGAGLRWYCRQLALLLPTGNADPHPRSICLYHRDITLSVLDCFTGQPVLLHQKEWWLAERKKDVQYWASSLCRFAALVCRELYAAIRHPVRYWEWLNWGEK
jgi:hypothetical protein